MFIGHDPVLVALSVVIAILGGYTGFAIAARVRDASALGRRLLLAGAAGFLAVGIWTMHFVGMLAAPIPSDTTYVVLPTIVSFLICALVVGVSLALVSIGDASVPRVVSAAVLLGAGIVSMHYVGIHGLSGRFAVAHDPWLMVLAAAIAIGTAYGGLRALLARHSGVPLVASAVAFGLAVSGMHYTAMAGMQFVPVGEAAGHHTTGLAASPQILSLVVALCCFVIAAGFLLTLVPDPRRPPAMVTPTGPMAPSPAATPSFAPNPTGVSTSRVTPAPLGGLGQPPRPQPASRLPVEAADGVYFIDAGHVRSIRADAHYTRIHDGSRERMCPWSISEAEAQLDPGCFIRVHRSHIVALPHVSFVRKEGEGAIVELDGPSPHRVPVSRAKITELKARLGLSKRSAASS